MGCTCGVSLLPGWFSFPRFSAGNFFLIASLVASAPGQCGGAQPGMPCLGKHIVSIPPGMVFALLQLPNERRCCVHAITSGFPVDCTYIIYISTLGILGCPFDAHWIPRWFPFGYTLGTLDFQLGPIAMPMGSPCHSHMGSHWSSIGSPWYSHMGGTHCMSMRFPWGPQRDPLGFPCGPIGASPCDAHVVSVCSLAGFPFQGFLQRLCF